MGVGGGLLAHAGGSHVARRAKEKARDAREAEAAKNYYMEAM